MPRRVNVHSGSVLGSTACASCEANNAEIEPHNLFRFNTVLRKHRNQTNNTKLLTVYAVKARHVSDAQFWIQLFVVLIFTVFATFTSQRRVGGISSLICMPCFLIPTQLMLRFPTLGELCEMNVKDLCNAFYLMRVAMQQRICSAMQHTCNT